MVDATHEESTVNPATLCHACVEAGMQPLHAVFAILSQEGVTAIRNEEEWFHVPAKKRPKETQKSSFPGAWGFVLGKAQRMGEIYYYIQRCLTSFLEPMNSHHWQDLRHTDQDQMDFERERGLEQKTFDAFNGTTWTPWWLRDWVAFTAMPSNKDILEPIFLSVLRQYGSTPGFLLPDLQDSSPAEVTWSRIPIFNRKYSEHLTRAMDRLKFALNQVMHAGPYGEAGGPMVYHDARQYHSVCFWFTCLLTANAGDKEGHPIATFEGQMAYDPGWITAYSSEHGRLRENAVKIRLLAASVDNQDPQNFQHAPLSVTQLKTLTERSATIRHKTSMQRRS